MADNREMWQSLSMDLETHDQLCVVRSPASSMPRKLKTAFPFLAKIAFFDDPAHCAQNADELADELEQRIADGVSVFPEGTKRILITGTPMSIPYMKLETDYSQSDAGQLETRIAAFIEML